MINKLGKEEIKKILLEFETCFVPPISSRNIDLDLYSEKLYNNAIFILEKDNEKNIGFISMYVNDEINKIAYLIFLAIHEKYRKLGLGKELITKAEKTAIDSGMKKMKLEVRKLNINAIRFYERNGYKYISDASETSIYMIKDLDIKKE